MKIFTGHRCDKGCVSRDVESHNRKQGGIGCMQFMTSVLNTTIEHTHTVVGIYKKQTYN